MTSNLFSTAKDESSAEKRSSDMEMGADKTEFNEAVPHYGSSAWFSLFGVTASIFSTLGWLVCIPVFVDYYQQTQLSAYTRSEIAWIPTLALFIIFASGVLFGRTFDNDGHYHLLALGTLLHVLGIMLTSVATTYVQIILCQGLLSALGTGMIVFASASVLPSWFSGDYLIRYFCFAGLGFSIGGIAFSAILAQLLATHSFGVAVRACGFLALGLLVFANLAIRSRIIPRERPFDLTSYVQHIKDSVFVLLSGGMFFVWWGMFVPLVYLVEESRVRNVGEHFSRYLPAILCSISIVAMAMPSIASKKFGPLNVLLAMSLIDTVLIFACLYPANGRQHMILFTCIYGLSFPATVGLIPAVLAANSERGEVAVRIRTAFLLAAVGALTGAPIAGKVMMDASDVSLKKGYLFAAASCAVGVTLLAVARARIAGTGIVKV